MEGLVYVRVYIFHSDNPELESSSLFPGAGIFLIKRLHKMKALLF